MADIKLLQGNQLQLADRVLDSNHHEIGVLTVSQIEKGDIHFHRPYTHTADFSYTGGVICYVGIETFQHEVNDSRHTYQLISRKIIK